VNGKGRLAFWGGVLLAGSLLAGACAPAPREPVPDAARGVPGFDTRDYPGDSAMRTWLEDSPYRWVGYYLPSPCYTGTGWQGTRSRLESMGWGLAVLYVGEQDWAEILPEDQVLTDPSHPRCARPNLTGARGTEHGRDAASVAAADGFLAGTTIYLNVERVENVSQDLAAYVRSWASAVLADGRYLAGLYAHARNAQELHPIVREEFRGAGRQDEPRLWVASSTGFDLRRGPDESGFPAAYIWQGVFDVRETWGGVTLLIDSNVARSGDPSR
jgi:hypothetical protein